MRVHAQNQSQPQEALHRRLLIRHTINNQSLPESPQALAPGREAKPDSSATSGPGYDFSRVAVRSKAPVGLQAKLKISTPGDIHEREADRVSEQVTSMPEARLRHASEIRMKQNGNAALELLQTKRVQATGSGEKAVPESVREVTRTSGEPLSRSTRDYMEGRFGYDFSQVRVHAGREAAKSARAVQARAYTLGSEIVFGKGEYAPATEEGKRLLAHELVHVVQQSGAPSRAGARSSTALESEADQVSERSLAGALPPGAIQTGVAPQISREPTPLHPLAEEELVDKFVELYARLPPKTRKRLLKYDTVAMGIAVDSDGDPRLIYTVAGNRRYKPLTQAADELGIMKWEPRARAEGRGSVGSPNDAEQLMLEGDDAEMKVVAIAASRTLCKDCGPAMKDAGVHIVDPQKFRTRLDARVASMPQTDGDEADAPASPRARARARSRSAPASGTENEAVEAIDTPPIPKAPRGKGPKAPKAPKTGKVPRLSKSDGAALGGTIAANIAGAAITMVAQHYIQKAWDKANEKEYDKLMQEAQPKIEAMIEAQLPAIKKLTDDGQAAYAYVTFRVIYNTAPDSGSKIPITTLSSVNLESITIANSEKPAKSETLSPELTTGEFVRQAVGIEITNVIVGYPIKLVNSINEQKKSAEDDIAFLDELIDEIETAPGERSDEMNEELSELQAEREEALAVQSMVEEKRAEIRRLREKLRQEKENEEKQKQKQALRKYETLQKQPAPRASSGNLLPGPGPSTLAAAPQEFPSPLAAGLDDKIDKADEVSRVFAAQKDQLANWAERLRASASSGNAGTPKYQSSYEKFKALRDPWPGQLRESLRLLRQNVPGAGQAIERMAAINDWLKTGGWDSLKQVPKPE